MARAPKVFVPPTLILCALLAADVGGLEAEVCSDRLGEACDEDATTALLQTRVASQEHHQQLRLDQQLQQQQKQQQRKQQQFQRLLDRVKHLTRDSLSDTERRALDQLRQASSKSKEEALPNKPTSDEMLWGGPSVAYSEMGYTIKNFSLAEVTSMMDCPGPESGLPEDFQGIWWMDQFGASSVAKDPNYPFAMVGLGETLVSFGSSKWEADSQCVTPATLYHGRQWTFYNDPGGVSTFDAHNRTHNTLSFCYLDDGVTLQLRTKQLKNTVALGPYSLGAWFADLLQFPDAGHGYVWEPAWLMDMSMVKKSWGWDRTTKMVSKFDGPSDSPLFELLTWLAESLLPVSRYPTLQIVDGHGQKTKYYYEVETLLAQSALPTDQYFIPHAGAGFST